MSKLRVLDIFSGIGGFSLALDQAGMETIAFCEWDRDAQKVLRKNWPEVPIFGDIKDLRVIGESLCEKGYDWTKVNEIDVIAGGFPCQDISVAGKQKGMVDEDGKRTRSGLWDEYKRLIQEINPRWVIIENVRNLLSNGLASVLKDLSEIGYDAEWEVISARSVGACHLRERIWIVAYPNGQHLRDFSERRAIGRDDLSPGGETVTRDDGTRGDAPDSDSDRRSQGVPLQARNEGESLLSERDGEERSPTNSTGPRSHPLDVSDGDGETFSEPIGFGGPWEAHPADSDDFRFWPTFTTEEEKLEWWTEATSEFRHWWATQPEICGIDDGLPDGLDEVDRNRLTPLRRTYERERKQRIKQLGNAIVPFIAKIIGDRIRFHESL